MRQSTKEIQFLAIILFKMKGIEKTAKVSCMFIIRFLTMHYGYKFRCFLFNKEVYSNENVFYDC